MAENQIVATISAMLTRFDALTDDDKVQIKQLCKDAGLKASFNKKCANCYQDALMLLKMHYNVKVPDADIITPSGNYVYHNGMKKVVWWWRHNYYELSSQSDDETIEKYMAVHPSQTHYSPVVPPEPSDTTTEETPTEGGNGAENDENADSGTADHPTEENPSTGENRENNEGVNGEGDNDGKEQSDD